MLLSNFEQAFTVITYLIRDFEANEKHYLKHNYVESVRSIISHKCERLDKEIDQFAFLAARQVYQPHSLAEEEINIVGGVN